MLNFTKEKTALPQEKTAEEVQHEHEARDNSQNELMVSRPDKPGGVVYPSFIPSGETAGFSPDVFGDLGHDSIGLCRPRHHKDNPIKHHKGNPTEHDEDGEVKSEHL